MKLKRLTSKVLIMVFCILEFSTFQINSMVYASNLSSKIPLDTENRKIKSILSSQLGFITAKALLSDEPEIEDGTDTEEPPEIEETPGEVITPEESSLEVKLILEKDDLEKPLYKGDKFRIKVSIEEFININKEDINSIEINLSYNKEILNLIKIDGSAEDNVIYDVENDKFVIVLNSESLDEDCVCTMEFDVIEIPEDSNTTQVVISALGESLEEFNIISTNASIDIEIQKREDQIIVNAESGYIMENDEEDESSYITRIIPGTTVNSFFDNVLIITDGDIVFSKTILNEEELEEIILSDDDLISTGTVLKIGDKSFILVVTGDITGSGKITPSDLGGLKLYSIQSQDYTLELPNIKACDVNNDGKITPTDIAQLKRVLIGDMEISNTVED